MSLPLLPRRAEGLVNEALQGFRVVIVNGPRQAGKSTLIKLAAERVGATLVTLDDRNVLRAARTDPSGFVEAYPSPLFIDEVQRGGEPLVLAIKAMVDRHPHQPGQFVLAGSSRFLTVPALSESLAGRARIIDLWPMSQGELGLGSDAFLDSLIQPTSQLRRIGGEPLDRSGLMRRVVTGGFPAVHAMPTDRLRAAWFDDYQRTLIQRDLTELSKVRQVAEVPRLVRLLAARTGQELSIASVARDIALSHDTVRHYLALLETLYLHQTLTPWSTNFTARAKRHPKVHFVDSGLVANVLGATPATLSLPTSLLAGPLVESFVVNELIRQRSWADERVDLFHFRDRDKREVDVIVEARDGRVAGVEVKAGRDVDERDFRWLVYLRDRLGDRFVNGVVLHLGDRPLPFGDRLTALPISSLWA